MGTATARFSLGVKSIQYGSITMSGTIGSGTATITSVDTSKAVLIHLGSRVASSSGGNGQVTLSLTNATTITGNRASTSQTCVANFVVVEYH